MRATLNFDEFYVLIVIFCECENHFPIRGCGSAARKGAAAHGRRFRTNQFVWRERGKLRFRGWKTGAGKRAVLAVKNEN